VIEGSSRITRANAARASSCGGLPAIQHEAVAPNGAILLGFFLKPNRFAYGEEFFTEAAKGRLAPTRRESTHTPSTLPSTCLRGLFWPTSLRLLSRPAWRSRIFAIKWTTLVYHRNCVKPDSPRRLGNPGEPPRDCHGFVAVVVHRHAAIV